MNYMREYDRWLESGALSEDDRDELLRIAGDDASIRSRFGARLEFGTAGLRGIMGAGLNRMNVYVIRHVTQSFAALILGEGGDAASRGVAIAYDCRLRSDEFACEAAGVLAANGIKSYIFESLRPTPELSFAVRELKCIAGINVTASHNPKEYNGYKVYWEDGAQLPPGHAAEIARVIERTDVFASVKHIPFERGVDEGLITIIGRELDEAFMKQVLAQSLSPDVIARQADMGIVFTPFHGAGHALIPEVLRRAGFKRVLPVPEQMVLDGAFPTVASPNPENPEGFALAIELAGRNDCPVCIGSDPDADRIGVMARAANGDYIALSGNQIGLLLLSYCIDVRAATGRLPKGSYAIKSIVTSYLADKICAQNGVEVVNVYTGFKFFGEKIKEYERLPDKTFIFGFEESNGYLAGTYARDKDAVVASLLTAEMTAYHREHGRTLLDALDDIYARYGYYVEKVVNIQFKGIDAQNDMSAMVERMRSDMPLSVGKLRVARVTDYKRDFVLDVATGSKTTTGFAPSNVLCFELEGGSRVFIRPSGTEPKVKLYFLMQGQNRDECMSLLAIFEREFRKLVDG